MKPPQRNDPQLALVKTKTREKNIKELGEQLEKSGMSKAQVRVEIAKLAGLAEVLNALGKIASSLDAIDRRLSTADRGERHD